MLFPFIIASSIFTFGRTSPVLERTDDSSSDLLSHQSIDSVTTFIPETHVDPAPLQNEAEEEQQMKKSPSHNDGYRQDSLEVSHGHLPVVDEPPTSEIPVDEPPGIRESEVSSTISSQLSAIEPTFETVIRIEKPMERIEIRLIDEKNVSSPVETVLSVPPLSPISPSTSDAETRENSQGRPYSTASGNEESSLVAPPRVNQVESGSHQEGDNAETREELAFSSESHISVSATLNEYHDKYKKVEYVSDTVLTGQLPETTPETPTSTLTLPVTELESLSVSRREEELQQEANHQVGVLQREHIASLLAVAKENRAPGGALDDVTNDDLPVFGDPSIDMADDEREPVEECLTNKESLAEDVVARLQSQAERLSKMIRKLNKQQTQLCTQQLPDGSATIFHDQYSQCPLWREEKAVHYYRLMRITYCANYDNWPNASKIQKTYGNMLPLYETLYAFSKQ